MCGKITRYLPNPEGRAGSTSSLLMGHDVCRMYARLCTAMSGITNSAEMPAPTIDHSCDADDPNRPLLVANLSRLHLLMPSQSQ